MIELRRVIAVQTGKGGVGKTSVVANVGGLLAAAGYRVLLVDLDHQGNLAEDLGYTGEEADTQGQALLTAVSTGTVPVPSRGIRPNLDVLPGGPRLNDLAAILYSRRNTQGIKASMAVAKALAPIAEQYDVILIDCPPGQDAMQEAALAAARWLLIPTRSDASSRKGLRATAERFVAAREINPDLELLGVVMFGITKGATRIDAQAREGIETDLGGAAPLFSAAIRYAEAAAVDARNRGQLMHELEASVATDAPWYERLKTGVKSPNLARSAGSVAGDYQSLAEEIIGHLTMQEQILAQAEPVPAEHAR